LFSVDSAHPILALRPPGFDIGIVTAWSPDVVVVWITKRGDGEVADMIQGDP
jgi:hypothetical protein